MRQELGETERGEMEGRKERPKDRRREKATGAVKEKVKGKRSVKGEVKE